MVVNDIVLQGVSANSPPGVFVQLLFAQGATGAGVAPYSALILANITSALSFTAGATYGPDTLVPLQSVQDAISLMGAGSPAHLMYAAFRSVNPTTPLYIAPVTAASGTAASQVITITVSASIQTSGVIQYRVDGKAPAQAVFAANDSATTIASNLAAAINGNVNLPVTATGGSSQFTVTAKVVGARGNNLRGFAQVVSGAGVTVSIASPANFTNGAGSDATGYTSTLNGLAINGNRYYYYIPEAGCDNIDGYTNAIAAEVQSQIDIMALPAVGIRQRIVFGSNDTVAHTSTVTTSLNDARLEVIQMKNLDLTAGEMAATWAGCLSLFETVPLNAQGVNFDGFGGDAASQPVWRIPAPLDGSAPSSSDIQTAITSGITPIKVSAGRSTVVVKRVTTRYFTTVGGTNYLDLRITDAGVVTICDRFFDDLQSKIALRFPRMMIGQEPAAGSPPAAPGVVTVSKVRNVCLEVIADYAAAGLIDGVATTQGLVVQQNQQNPSSIGIVVPLANNLPAHQFLISGLQVGPVFI